MILLGRDTPRLRHHVFLSHWRGLTQEHFPPRSCQSAWHSNITYVISPHATPQTITTSHQHKAQRHKPREHCQPFFATAKRTPSCFSFPKNTRTHAKSTFHQGHAKRFPDTAQTSCFTHQQLVPRDRRVKNDQQYDIWSRLPLLDEIQLSTFFFARVLTPCGLCPGQHIGESKPKTQKTNTKATPKTQQNPKRTSTTSGHNLGCVLRPWRLQL